MIICRQNILPLGQYKAMFLLGILFLKSKAEMSEHEMNHEKIHSRQFVELMISGLLITLPFVSWIWWLPLTAPFLFYFWYGIEWFIHLIRLRDTHEAYHRISFEVEAYDNQDVEWYLRERKLFSFLKYVQ